MAATHEVMADFCKAVLKARIRRVVKMVGETFVADTKSIKPTLNVTAPTFDFGDFLDTVTFPAAVYQEFAPAGSDRLSLPYPECFFLVVERVDTNAEGAVYQDYVLHLLEEADGSITGRPYYRLREYPGDWFEEPFTVHWGVADDDAVNIRELPGMNPTHRKQYAGHATVVRLWIGAAAWLLERRA